MIKWYKNLCIRVFNQYHFQPNNRFKYIIATTPVEIMYCVCWATRGGKGPSVPTSTVYQTFATMMAKLQYSAASGMCVWFRYTLWGKKMSPQRWQYNSCPYGKIVWSP